MKKRTIVYIVVGAIVFHAAFFMVFSQMRALPKARYIAPPNFGHRAEYYDDPKTGVRTIWHEFRVTTKLSGLPEEEKQKHQPPVPNGA